MQRRRQELKQLAEALLRKLRPSRIVVAGGPRAGKTTLAATLSDFYKVPAHGTDELRALDWSESSLVASTWLDRQGPWICEGVVMPRALRKWLASHDDGAPADYLVWMNAPVSERVRGQEAMAKGCASVFEEILVELTQRGTQVLMP